jgi:hypothetical protein
VHAKSAKGKELASTHTDADGAYSLRLPIGSYTLVAVTPRPLPRCSPAHVVVKAKQTIRVRIACDTGIR